MMSNVGKKRQVQTTLVSSPSYKVLANYDQTVEQLIEAGHYDWGEKKITSKSLPSSQSGQTEILITLMNFNHDVSEEDVIEEMKNKDLRPATLKEILFLGAQHHDLGWNYNILALGSRLHISTSYGGYFEVPEIFGYIGGRGVGLAFKVGDCWPNKYQFAAVPK
jgi:hypothetical protein